jgi:hypothetical protein
VQFAYGREIAFTGCPAAFAIYEARPNYCARLCAVSFHWSDAA